MDRSKPYGAIVDQVCDEPTPIIFLTSGGGAIIIENKNDETMGNTMIMRPYDPNKQTQQLAD